MPMDTSGKIASHVMIARVWIDGGFGVDAGVASTVSADWVAVSLVTRNHNAPASQNSPASAAARTVAGMAVRECTARDHDGGRCRAAVADGAPISLCTQHLLVAHDWIVRDVGVTDLLPSPCLACGSRTGIRYPTGWICAICEWRVGELPDGETEPARVDVVYYLRWRDRIKIGTSGNPRGRLAALPYDELLAFERGDRRLEQRRHAQFAGQRIPGSEWFRVNDELLAHVAELRVDEPWDQYHRWVSRAVALRG